MKRILILVWLLLFVCSTWHNTIAQPLKISVSTAGVWEAGSWSLVEVMVSGGSGSGPCRLSQSFPVGFKIEPADVAGGDLFFTDNSLNIVWTKLPTGESFKFSYLVMPEPALSGPLELTGIIYAVMGAGKRFEIPVPTKNITIKGGGLSASGQQENGVEVLFRVQVLSSSARIADQELKKRLGITFKEKVTIVPAGTIFKYQVGELPTYESAASLLERFKAGGVTGAFIVAWQGNSQVSVEKARLLAK
jgi:hypothetical protein